MSWEHAHYEKAFAVFLTAGCAEMDPKRGVPKTWDRAAVEDDVSWTILPPAEEAERGANQE
jgi:hypothetical protein